VGMDRHDLLAATLQEFGDLVGGSMRVAREPNHCPCLAVVQHEIDPRLMLPRSAHGYTVVPIPPVGSSCLARWARLVCGTSGDVAVTGSVLNSSAELSRLRQTPQIPGLPFVRAVVQRRNRQRACFDLG